MPDTTQPPHRDTILINSFPAPPQFTSTTLIFSLNSTKIILDNPNPDITLLDFIRNQGLTGTKLGCNEGGCGACTVVIGELEESKVGGKLFPRYRSVNSCLTPLIAVHGCHVLTIEGIGSSTHPHPLQERFGKAGYFQCSACASGIIMAFYAQLRAAYMKEDGDDAEGESKGLTEMEIEKAFDGNLCRCTGYRCLLDVAKTFAVDHKPLGNITVLKDKDEAEVNTNGVEKEKNGNGEKYFGIDQGANGDGPIDKDSLAPNANEDPVPIREPTIIAKESGPTSEIRSEPEDVAQAPALEGLIESKPVLCGKGDDCCKNKPNGAGGGGCNGGSEERPKPLPGIPQFQFKAYKPDAEPIFPPWLKRYSGFQGKDLILVQKIFSIDGEKSPLGNVWLRPGSLSSLVDVMRRYPGAKIRSGNTETGIEVKFKASRFAVSVFVSDHIKELATWKCTTEGLYVGSALPLTDLVEACKILQGSDEHKDKKERVMLLQAIRDNLEHFASNQIRNVATIAGNITTASPISDLNPIWVAVGAELKYVDPKDIQYDENANGGKGAFAEKSVNMRNFFLGYRKTALPVGAVVTHLFVPFPKREESVRTYTRAYKQSKRKDDDIAIVTCCLHAVVEGKTIKDIRLSYGGMAPTTVQSKDAQAFLVGKEIGDDVAFIGALERLSTVDFPLPFGVPGGMAVFRKTLTLSFFAKFYSEIAADLGIQLESKIPKIEQLIHSELHRGPSRGHQDLEEVDVKKAVGQNVPHLSHMAHVTGEAQYVDDMPRLANELVAGFVLSQKPRAKLRSVDASVALEMEGVHDFVSVKDLRGNNHWNPPGMDEVLFADGDVYSCGQVIGVVLAENKYQAQAAARAVKIEYEDLPYILTIDEAIAADSFFPPRPVLERGDISKIDEADHVMEGIWRMGGQEQFYIETNACVVNPNREQEYEVWSSTQNPNETQVFVASALAVPQNRIVVRTKRLGGGFGGKETRPIAFAAVLAVAAQKVKRPVRCMLDRDEDMIMTGQRHPFMAKWKVGFNRDGKFVGLDIQIYNNGGWSQDLSQAVLERAMSHSDGTSWVPNFRIEGKICKTNTMSNTAFRGFGGPQGILLHEHIATLMAEKLDVDPEYIREINMYEEGQRTHFQMEVIDWNVPTLWKQVKAASEFEKRQAEVEEFNRVNTWKKRGIAMMATKFGISFTALHLNQGHALISIYEGDGSISLFHQGTEMGQGLHTKMAQICATELNCPIEKIHIMETNTMTVANGSATAASASSDLNGMAVKDACDQLNARLAPYREKMPDADWAKLVHVAYFDRVPLAATGHYQTPDIRATTADDGTRRPFFYFTQGASCTEVEIDVVSGDHMIVQSDVIMDIGRSINPSIDIGQIEGAFTQGFGLATMEESLWLPNGQLATRGPGAYKIPAALDTPRIFNVSFLKAKDAKTAHLKTIQGSKGVGEPPLAMGFTAFFALKKAIAAARADNGLTGPWNLISPATCERIRVACGDPLLAIAEKGAEQKEGEKSFFVSIF